MHFEWDEKKAASNSRKHGVSFEEATTVFENPLASVFEDKDHSEDEPREIIIGYSILQRLLLICYLEQEGDAIRIYSARPATRLEREDYEEDAIR